MLFYSPNLVEKTDFSVYDLRDHPDFHFKSGSLIIYISHDLNPKLSTINVGQVLNAGPNGKVNFSSLFSFYFFIN